MRWQIKKRQAVWLAVLISLLDFDFLTKIQAILSPNWANAAVGLLAAWRRLGRCVAIDQRL